MIFLEAQPNPTLQTARSVNAAAGAEGGRAVRLAAGGLGRRQRQVRPPGERTRLPRRRPQLVLLLPGRKPKFRLGLERFLESELLDRLKIPFLEESPWSDSF